VTFNRARASDELSFAMPADSFLDCNERWRVATLVDASTSKYIRALRSPNFAASCGMDDPPF
jgi:hypothetical protein